MQTSSNIPINAQDSQSIFNSHLINRSVAVALVLLVSGCWAAAIKPPVSEINKLSTILVVPVESPPLEIIPDPIEERIPAYRHYRNMSVDFPLEKKLYRTSGDVIIAGLVSPGDDEQDVTIQDDKIPLSLAIATEPKQAWIPTLVLAQQAVTQLTENNIKAILSRDYYRLPMADADRNAQLAHWHDAISEWYNQGTSTIDYRQLGQEHVDAVLEVGIDTYRIFDAQTSLQVLIKLIDPNTQQIIGRTSAKTFSVEDSPQTLLNHEAEKFKQLMTEMGAQLVARGFSDLGLPLKVYGQHIMPAKSPVDRLTP
ncbi:hypothetical protein ABXJ76_09435 [Methylobacter sp. G7]|uniref:hypothetical protein n=1 Tax=Methylobacter sp. G7 TaxID=3230117 RepID=UPI003D808D93